MDFSLGYTLDTDIIHKSESDILKKKILELEEQLANSDDKYKNVLKNLGGLTVYINKQKEMQDNHYFYVESLKKNIQDLSYTIAKNKLDYEKKIKELQDHINLKLEKEYQIMQLCRILNTHGEIIKEVEKEENFNKN